MPTRLAFDDLPPQFQRQLEAQGFLAEAAEDSLEHIDFSKLLLLYEGSQQWDYYLNLQSKLVYCKAKEGTGCEDSCFGTLTSFNHTREHYVL